MGNGHTGSSPAHGDGDQEWAELLARTVAHLAAQLTVTQLRLRALATELATHDTASEAAVHDHLRHLARDEGGAYLRANLGDALADIIDLDELQHSLVAYLSDEPSRR